MVERHAHPLVAAALAWAREATDADLDQRYRIASVVECVGILVIDHAIGNAEGVALALRELTRIMGEESSS